MPLTVSKAQLWAIHGADRCGLLADALEPLAAAGAELRVAMTWCHDRPREGGNDVHGRASVEIYPVAGRKAQAAARAAGFVPSATPCLFVEGADRPGLGADVSRAIASVGVSMTFLVAQSAGRRFSAAIGFRSSTDAAIAAKALRSMPDKRPSRKR
jgi:predicted amino acid-binding ACT domain protein